MSSLQNLLTNLEPIDLFAFQDQYSILQQLKNTPQDKRWHPEGDVLNHTNLVLQEAYKLFEEIQDKEQCINVYISALLHDFGKPLTTVIQPSGKITAHGHPEMGVSIAREFLRTHFPAMGIMRREFILTLVENHLAPLLFSKEKASPRAYHKLSIKTNTRELFFLGLADTLGRGYSTEENRGEIARKFAIQCAEYSVFDVPYELPGFALANTLLYNSLRWAYLNNNLSLDNSKKVAEITKLTEQSPCEVIILVGAPGSGKTTWAKDNFPGLKYICMDDLRKELCGDASDQSRNEEIAKVGFGQLRENLRLRNSVIWDATSVSVKLRKHLINTARQYGSYVTIVWFDTPLEVSLLRNSQRERVVPEDVIRKKHSQLQFPRPYEYDRLLVVPK